MTDNIKYLLGFVITVLLFIGGMFTQKSCQKCPEPPKYRTEKQIIDSMLKVIPHDTVKIKVKGEVKWYPEYIHDTTNIFIKDSMLFAKFYEGHDVIWDSIPIAETYPYIFSKPFVSYFNKIQDGDTVEGSYGFPVNEFDLTIRKKPDSIYVKTINNYIVEERNWYFGAGLHFGAGLGGGFTGQIGLSFQLGYKIWSW